MIPAVAPRIPNAVSANASLTSRKHTLLVLDPGHFHAALSLRKPHPRLDDHVYVYGQDGPDLDAFLRLVSSFNTRPSDPTRWQLDVYRGSDPLGRLLAERRGDVAIVAGRNDTKMRAIARLHQAGFAVLGDKPWLIDAAELPLLQATVSGPPLAMDIMTERHEITNRLQRALIRRPEVFGAFRRDGAEPALHLRSVHHLYKLVNGQPLVRPAWYFDLAVQGEGMTDVNTHLVDLAQWMVGGESAVDYARDVELAGARQWPTEVPLERFAQITGLPAFPDALRAHVHGDTLHYLCNAALSCRLRGVPVTLEAIWDLAIPDGGGDTHYAIARGSRADVVIEQGPHTRFVPELFVRPAAAGAVDGRVLAEVVATLQEIYPGIAVEPDGAAFRITIPSALRTTHEQHFAAVLDAFLGLLDSGTAPAEIGPELVAKYTLLVRGKERAHRAA
jgi:predicted dehydrogenase